MDLVFLSHMREAAELQQQQQRHKQLVAGGAAAAAGPAAGIAAGIAAANAAAAGFTVGGSSGKPGSPSKAARLLQRRAGGLAGPDVSSWEGLWCSLGAMSGRRMLPLLQVGGEGRQAQAHSAGIGQYACRVDVLAGCVCCVVEQS